MLLECLCPTSGQSGTRMNKNSDAGSSPVPEHSDTGLDTLAPAPDWDAGMPLPSRGYSVWLECLAVNAKVATVVGSIPASSNTVGNWKAGDEAVLNTVHTQKIKNKSPVSFYK